MKKIVFYILLLSGSLMMACTESSDSSDAGDYINPGFTAKTVNSTISYSNIAGGCTAGSGCQAIIYSGKVNNNKYVGIAIKNTSHNVKIYWSASSIPTGTVSLTGCTVKEDATTVSNTPITMEIINNGDTTYTINFDSAVAGTSINASSSITAQGY